MEDFLNDEQGAVVLQAAGFQQDHYPEYWEDQGGPEYGPHVVGHQTHTTWTFPFPGTRRYHYLVTFADGYLEVGEDCQYDDYPDFTDQE